MARSFESTDGDATWEAVEQLVGEVVELGKGNLSVEDYYAAFLERVVVALSAVGAAAWRVDGRKSSVLIASHQYPAALRHSSTNTERVFDAVLRNGAGADELVSAAAAGGATTNWATVARTVHPNEHTTIAVEVVLEPTTSGNVYEGSGRLLGLFCDSAVDYHRSRELEDLRRKETAMRGLDDLALRFHASLDPRVTAYTIANDGRQWIGCDRISVVRIRGKHAQLISVSGVDQAERRGDEVRRLESLASAVACAASTVAWTRGQASNLGDPLDEPLQAYVDASNSCAILAVPLYRRANNDSSPLSLPVLATLIAETFDDRLADPLIRSRVELVARHAAPAMGAAIEHHQLPLVPLQTAVANAVHRMRRSPMRILAYVGVVAVLIGALCLIPADFAIEAHGTLQPKIARNVYSPIDGVVEEVLVEHGDQVLTGTKLLQIRDPKLDLEISRINGELATATTRLITVRASRASQDQRDKPRDRDRELATEEQQLTQQVHGLESQLNILSRLQAQLRVTSPLDGVVLTWNARDLLENRPVKRGQLLLTVAEPSGPWVLELQVRDNDVGHVLEAKQQSDDPLLVSFLLGTDAGLTHHGHVESVAMVAEAEEDGAVRAAVTVNVDGDESGDFRTGASVTARIHCGEKPIGYVWLRGLIDAVRSSLWL